MSRVSALFNPRQRSRLAPITTRDPARYPAWERPLEEQFLQTLLTNTLGNTYYVSSKDLLKESHKVHDRMLAKDPEFAAKALGYGRNKGFMRTQPILGLAKLALADKAQFERVFGQVVRSPNDLRDFLTILCSLGWKKSGKFFKRVAGNWLAQKLSEYWAIKYGAEKQGDWSIKEMMIILHPKGMRGDLAEYMMGREVNLAELPQIAAFEQLKRATDAKEKVRLITEGRLPHEVASTFAGKDTEVWDAIAPQMPIFALLRNLATLERHGVLENHRALVEGKFNDPEMIGKSKVLPFRFLDAIDHVSAPWAQDALRDAL
jgi:60 kDa SS-A/Ro ribonucleoprotein